MGCIESCFRIDTSKKLTLPNSPSNAWNAKLGYTTQTLLHSSYLFNFNTKKLEKYKSGIKVQFSNFVLSGIKSAYDNIKDNYEKFKNSYYVVCPVYSDNVTKKILDTQFSVTGTCFNNETELFATKREISEEIGVTVCNNSAIILVSNFFNQKRREYTFIADITNERAFDPKLDSVNDGKDDKSKKIQVIVIGEINNLKRIYSNVYNRPPSDDLETIKHLRFVSLKDFF